MAYRTFTPVPRRLQLVETAGHAGGFVRYWCMGKEPVPNVQGVTRFLREVIGCNCPDEPSKCPECKSTWILEPKIGIESKTQAGEAPTR